MSYPFMKVETLLMLLLTYVTYELITRLDEPKRGFANIKRNLGSIVAAWQQCGGRSGGSAAVAGSAMAAQWQ